MAKPVASKSVKRGKPQGRREKSNAVIKENRPALLTELLLEELVEIVIDYFKDDAYPFIVATHNWSLKGRPRVAVDSTRVYLMADSEGIKGLSHSVAKEGVRHCIEFGDPQWFDCDRFASSHNGRYVFFTHLYKTSTERREQARYGTKWLMHDSKFEGGRPKPVVFDGEESINGVLSRDGKTLLLYDGGGDPTTRVYRIVEAAGSNPTAAAKFELSGKSRAVSDKGNRVLVENAGQLEVHDIDRDASRLAYQIGVTDPICVCALNEDGSRAAFATYGGGLHIIEMDSGVDGTAHQPAIVTIEGPKPAGSIDRLVYANGSRLHVLHDGDKVSLFDSATRTFILLEASQEGQRTVDLAISPNAKHIAILQANATNRPFTHRAIVKRKLGKTDWRNLFGYKARAKSQSQS